MDWRETKSLTTLLNQVNALYPNRDKASDGELGDTRIVPGITRVLGDRVLDTRAIYDTLIVPHVTLTGDAVTVVLPEHNLMANVQDNRASVTY